VLGITASEGGDEGLVSTQRAEEEELMNIDAPPPVRPWLLHGPETPAIISAMLKLFHHSAGLLEYINKIRSKRSMAPIDARLKEDLLQGALVGVKVKMCTRGAPGDLAAIYSIPEAEAKLWGKALERAKRKGEDLFEQPTPEELKVRLFHSQSFLSRTSLE
jgi:ribonuclease P/MRP protein subunit POP1